MKYKVSELISFGKVRRPVRCRICGDIINKVGVKIKYASNTRRSGKVHIVLHFDCALGLRHKEIKNAIFNKHITSNRYGCSYCGKINANKELKNIASIYLHPVCCDLLEKKLNKLFEENKSELLISLI